MNEKKRLDLFSIAHEKVGKFEGDIYNGRGNVSHTFFLSVATLSLLQCYLDAYMLIILTITYFTSAKSAYPMVAKLVFSNSFTCDEKL